MAKAGIIQAGCEGVGWARQGSGAVERTDRKARMVPVKRIRQRRHLFFHGLRIETLKYGFKVPAIVFGLFSDSYEPLHRRVPAHILYKGK